MSHVDFTFFIGNTKGIPQLPVQLWEDLLTPTVKRTNSYTGGFWKTMDQR